MKHCLHVHWPYATVITPPLHIWKFNGVSEKNNNNIKPKRVRYVIRKYTTCAVQYAGKRARIPPDFEKRNTERISVRRKNFIPVIVISGYLPLRVSGPVSPVQFSSPCQF